MSPSESPSRGVPVPNREALRKALAQTRTSQTGPKGHEIIAKTLKDLGVTHVYGVSGTPIHETLAACSKEGIRAIGVRHQQASVFAAAAHNYIEGSLKAVPIASAGPGVTNMMTGLLFAHENCWPLIAIGGRRPLNSAGRGYFQDLNARPLVSSITKHAEMVSAPDQIEATLRKCAKLAFSGRPGPVYLDVTEEALGGKGSLQTIPVAESSPVPSPSDAAISTAVELLVTARKPLVVFGKGLRWNDAFRDLRNLLEQLNIPFVASPMGRGLLPDDHKLAFSAVSTTAQGEADVVLLAGARLNWQFRFGAELNPQAKLITIEIEETEFGINRVEHLRLNGDAKEILGRMNQRIKSVVGDRKIPDRNDWLLSLQRSRDARAGETVNHTASGTIAISPQRLMAEVGKFLPPDAITCLDGHLCMLAAQEHIPCLEPLTRINVGSNGTLGVGVPFAMAAKLARPNQMVVAICGDSAFGFSAMELETAVRHKIPIIVIVADNQGIWGGHIQKAHYPETHERVAMYGPDLHYEQIGSAFGAHAEHVTSADEIRPALERAVRSNKPACIHVRIDPLSPLK